MNGRQPAQHRGLQMRRAPPITSAERAAVENRWDTIDKVEDALRAQGIVLEREQPKEACPTLTVEDLTTDSSRDYTATYVLLLAWFTYVGTLLARAKARRLQFRNTCDQLEAQTRKTMRDAVIGKKPTAQEFEDELLTNPEYQDAKQKLQEYEQHEILLAQTVSGVETSLRVISRQVEIRRQEWSASNNSNNGVLPQPSRGSFAPGRSPR